MKEIIITTLAILGFVFLVLGTIATIFVVKESMEEKFDEKVTDSIARITGKKWNRFYNPVRELEELTDEFDEFEDNISNVIANMQSQIDYLKKETERQYKVLKEETKRLDKEQA